MKDRLKKIRKNSGLTQVEFGSRISVKGNTITGYETGIRMPSDAVIFSICREFNINEEWLRNGTGEMSMDLNKDDRFSMNLSKLGRTENEFIISAVNVLAETEPEKLEIVEMLMKKLLGI